jgi:ElaB/YqjD/DUF883 family membrane-anchored ribosome-binding protein
MAASVQPDFAALQADIQQLRTDFAKMTADMRSFANSGVAQASGMAQETADKMWGEVRQKAQQVSHEIEERPFASALMAFATGLVLGMLLNAKRA